MKNILVPLMGYENDARALEAAYLVAKRFESRIHSLRVHPDPMQIVAVAAVQQFGSKMGNVELIHALQKNAEERSAAAAAAFEDFLKRHFANRAASRAPEGVEATMRQIEGDPVRDTVAAARFHDLVVLARAPEGGQFSPDAIANILVGCGRPVLLAPEAPLAALGSTVAIAWKDTAEAARAVTASMPLLKRAERIAVLSVAETAEETEHSKQSSELLASQLRHHGLAAEARSVAAAGRDTAEALLQTAHEAGADLLVAGAYGHSRVRELVFGGFTRSALKACDLPLLMLH